MTYTFQQVLAYCKSKQISLTNQQELILKIIQESSQPLTSVEILDLLHVQNPTANRMTIYRTIEYLIRNNLIHKVQSNNTYTLCQHPSDHSCQILVCTKCGVQHEIHSHQICSSLDLIQLEYGFTFSNPLEITGICDKCR